MSFVLSVVCIHPTAEPQLSTGALLIQEAVQDSGASRRAGYVAGLSNFFAQPVEGRAYYVQVDRGDRYPTSRDFFSYPDNDPADRLPIVVQLGDKYRSSFDRLLCELLDVSGPRRVLVVAEWNGDVTDVTVSRAAIKDHLAAGDHFLNGPWSREEFWEHHDQGLVYYPSVTVVAELAL